LKWEELMNKLLGMTLAAAALFAEEPGHDEKPEKMGVEVFSHPGVRQVSGFYGITPNIRFFGSAAEVEGQKFGLVGAGPALKKKSGIYEWELSAWFGAGFGKRISGAAAGLSAELTVAEKLQLGTHLTTLSFQTRDAATEQKSTWPILTFGEPAAEVCWKVGRLCLGGEMDWLQTNEGQTTGAGPLMKIRAAKSTKLSLAYLRNNQGCNEVRWSFQWSH
jgi:hypothetical protein